MEEAATSVRRRFWAALSQAKVLDRASTYNVSGANERTEDALADVTSE